MRKALKFIMTAFLAVACAQSFAAVQGREQALSELKGLKAQNTQTLRDVEIRIKNLLEPKPPMSGPVNETEILSLTSQRQELLWRQELLDRLLFQLDTHFTNSQTDLRSFFSQRLLEMARVDLLNTTGGQNLWKQMTYLSQSLRELPERDENIIGFIDGYLKNSSFRQPLKPEQYLQSRHYTNGHESVAAAPIAKDQVGEAVEAKLRQIEKPAAKPQVEVPQN